MWWKWIFYSRVSARRSCQCVIHFKLPPTAVDCLGSEMHGWQCQSRSRSVATCEYVFNSKVKLKSDIFCVVEVLWERNIGSVMFYVLDMAQERRQACPSVVVKEKQWCFSEKGPFGYGRTLIAYAGSGPPRHDGPGGVFTIAILKNHDQPFYKARNITIDTCTWVPVILYQWPRNYWGGGGGSFLVIPAFLGVVMQMCNLQFPCRSGQCSVTEDRVTS